MCEYVNLNDGKCKVNNEVCPYTYFCNKIQSYKPLSSMPISCKIKEKLNIPKGAYKVCFERHGKLYIDKDGYIEIVENPFDYVPVYVKMTKLKNDKWKLKEVAVQYGR